ncbi:facilitated trehalose transporter Tret1-like isoform X2 [Eriocheir sinensis]|uniref:facilitated trehalose transporter Tret1-like isoform X2 n=1 Tax=Eriocheir sinensis TaxID=95602 RepID=UPI0021C959CC|nr:facilitated trehalose transporter Tret1-like isoform X2 [Eriocheir sinensis]
MGTANTMKKCRACRISCLPRTVLSMLLQNAKHIEALHQCHMEVTNTCCCYWGSLARQLCSILVVSSSMLQVGLLLGWPAVLPAMQADNSTAINITDYDVSWLVSSVGLAGMFTNLPSGFLIDYFGYRRLLTMCLLPVSASWFMQAFTTSITLLYIGRILGGMALMLFTTLVPPLMIELVEPTYRGFLGCGSEIVVAFGMLLAFLMADFLHWKTVTILSALPFIPIFFLSLGVPESPFWLVRAGRVREAEAALIKLRGPARRPAAQDELLQIQRSIREQPQTTFIEQVHQIVVPHNLRPLLLVSAVMILRELGGQFAIFSYAAYFFATAGVMINPLTCTVLVGVMRLISTFTCAFLLDRVGRRIILMAGCSCCAISAAVGGLFLLWEVQGSSWVPLVAVLAFAFGYGFGVCPIPWILMGELLPTPVRVVGSTIVVFIFSAMQVFVGLMFPRLVDEVGLGGSFLVFAVFNTFLAVLVRLFLPETASQSLHTLEHAFDRANSTTVPLKTTPDKKTTPVDETGTSHEPLL